MKYTLLGNTGLVVSKLAFGTMTFGSGNIPSVYKVNQNDAKAMVDRALALGINFFDTADAYADGQSEIMLGKLLKEHRHEVIISTKVGMRIGRGLIQTGLSRKHLMDSCEASLKRLGTDTIDLYIVHKTDPLTPLEETLEALNDLVRSGKVRYIGYSNWPAWMAAKALQMQKDHGWAQFITSQMYYSLVGRDIEHEVAPFLKASGVGLMVWSPLASGFLSGKYNRDNLTNPNNRLSGFDFIPLNKEWGFQVVDKLREIADSHGASPAQVSLSWLLAQSHVSTVLLGSSNIKQLEDNLKAVNLSLCSEELTVLDDLTRPAALYPNWFTEALLDPQVMEAIRQK
ncbi:aldo/keto reductase [Bacillus sp. 03113]|uniref:aldo/keto reductase n=1 Tax=Bacillus sp. 03113 TaxID=2578211 RepID=UPI0011438873|nr:aldo/keto reductase [Bacillus sp. 03113]